jgi:hypothetical protein
VSHATGVPVAAAALSPAKCTVRSEAGTSTARTFAGVLVPPACRLGATCGAGVRLWRRGGGRRRLNANSATATATKPHRGEACLSQSRFPQVGRALSTPRSLNVPYPAITTLSSSRVFFFCGVLHTPYGLNYDHVRSKIRREGSVLACCSCIGFAL